MVLRISLKDLKMNKSKDDVWAMCVSCEKWRRLIGVRSGDIIPEEWKCEMNDDPKYSTCRKMEEEWHNSSFDGSPAGYVVDGFHVGTLVWAAEVGYSWWPGMIDKDPDYNCHIWLDGKKTLYHVVFFGKRYSRSWLDSKKIHPLTKDFDPRSMSDVFGRRAKLVWNTEAMTTARELADEATEEDGVKERVRKFGCRAHFKIVQTASSSENSRRSNARPLAIFKTSTPIVVKKKSKVFGRKMDKRSNPRKPDRQIDSVISSVVEKAKQGQQDTSFGELSAIEPNKSVDLVVAKVGSSKLSTGNLDKSLKRLNNLDLDFEEEPKRKKHKADENKKKKGDSAKARTEDVGEFMDNFLNSLVDSRKLGGSGNSGVRKKKLNRSGEHKSKLGSRSPSPIGSIGGNENASEGAGGELSQTRDSSISVQFRDSSGSDEVLDVIPESSTPSKSTTPTGELACLQLLLLGAAAFATSDADTEQFVENGSATKDSQCFTEDRMDSAKSAAGGEDVYKKQDAVVGSILSGALASSENVHGIGPVHAADFIAEKFTEGPDFSQQTNENIENKKKKFAPIFVKKFTID